jgi:ferredoxin-NADP reductase/nitrite reductase/ring-hydroxylating ferredoxin subunit
MSWIPVASSSDLVSRHVFQGRLEGRELAIWRADDGHVNIWENRCLHRGVRLTIGINTGSELVCQYHGWRYANRTAGCTYIPAHPADAPARTICNRTYPALEKDGMIWTHFQETEPPVVEQSADKILTLRALPIRASADLAELFLPEFLGHGISADTDYGRLQLFIQPVDGDRIILRGAVENPLNDELETLRYFNTVFTRARDQLEIEAAKHPAPQLFEPVYTAVSAELAQMPAIGTATSGLTVVIERKVEVGTDICSLELVPLKDKLPTWQPGAHIDVALPNGLTRQYSLTNAPGQTDRYIIGVKRDPASAGGSKCIHDDLREGDLLSISEPRHNFPLRRDAQKTIFIAGGIGATPLLSMASALQKDGADFEFHYFAQAQDHMAFPDRLQEMDLNLVPQLGLEPNAVKERLLAILSKSDKDHQVYICGPAPLLDQARKSASELGWPDSAIHFEYFKNTLEIDDSSSFEVALARSAVTLQVPAGRTILAVLRENGVKLPASCEQGACGTCMATVLEGDPDHQDVYLNAEERASGNKILACVSRAKSDRLVLDL